MSNENKTILQWALEYHKQGWCVIPIKTGTKKPALNSWKKYQTEQPDERLLRKWFSDNNKSIAVVLGPASNDLVCRDFDTMAEYEQWVKGYPDLAGKLPTVKTSTGMHVYFEADVQGIKHISNGELRGKGGYCLLPPSIHPDGPQYEWVNPLNNGNLIALEPELAGFITNLTEHTKQTEHTQQTHTIGEEEKRKRTIVLIEKTLPKHYGERNQKIFFLALYLRSNDWGADPKGFRWAVEEWHRRALPNITTKDFLETWLDFLVAWKNLKHGIIDPIQIFEFCKKLEPPEQLVKDHPKYPKLHLLCVWCRELHKAHEVFGSTAYLGCRTIGKALKISHETGNKYFRILALEAYLDILEIGKMTESGGIATRYRYIAN
ncbi:bifunctional DNA primase/polymerase [Planctomycetota bacterium]